MKMSPESGEKYVKMKNPLQVKTVFNKYVCEFWCERKTGEELFNERGLWYLILTV